MAEPAPDAAPPGRPERTSDLLQRLIDPAADTDTRISIGEIARILGARAFGLLLFVFAVPCMLPSPPPIPLICVTVMGLVALNMMVGRSIVWLPDRVAQRSIDRAMLARLIARVTPTVVRIERICQPRWPWMTEGDHKMVIGGVVILLGLILLIPFPLVGNFTPGLAIAVMGLGLAERDGVVLALGLVASLVAVIFSAFLGWLSIELFWITWDWVLGWF